MIFRSIQKVDNHSLAMVIRKCLEESGADLIGTVYHDASTDHLYELFQNPLSYYVVAVDDGGKIVGGCGLYPTLGLPSGRVELVKMYLDSSVRGKGFGRHLLKICITKAKELGYHEIYLETLPQLQKAMALYEKNGFEYIKDRCGDSGHSGCSIFMLHKLKTDNKVAFTTSE